MIFFANLLVYSGSMTIDVRSICRYLNFLDFFFYLHNYFYKF